MTTRTARRSSLTLAAITAAAIGVTIAAFTLSGRSPGHVFPRLHPAAAPSDWRHLTLPNRTAVLSYPPSLRPISGDKVAVSAARLGRHGAFQFYLNATPRQGSEQLARWPAFRLHLLRSDTAVSARQVAEAHGVKFRGGTGSCVIDRYITRVGGHHFQEIACLVVGRTSASVIVAAAPTAAWTQERPLLLQAVAAYLIR